MSRIKISMNAPLLATTTCFWSSSLNAFIFRFSPKTITLYDLANLFGLKPQGMEIDPTFSIDSTTFNSVIIKNTDYDPFMKSYFNRKDEVSQAEHVAFLLTRLNKFISCNRSKNVSKVYLGIVMALATGVELALGSLILSHIYKRLNDLITMENEKLNRTARGQIWMV